MSSSDPDTCAVCFDIFNKSTRAKTSCPGCNIGICRTCLQTYVLGDIRDSPPCVNPECSHGWDRDFLDGEFTRTFRLQTYKEHRETVLRDRERSRLPETQDDAAAYRQAKQIYDIEIQKAVEIQKRIGELEQELYRISGRNAQARAVIESYGRSRIQAGGAATAAKQESEPKRQFIRACPAVDCKGFLSTAWKCGLCEKWTCHECHDLIGTTKDAEHTCDSDKVASARLIEQESRPCPKCGARICKIDGCNQMWCTACNTGFDWRTGTLAKGPIHNPHFFQWLQRNGGGAGAAAVGGAGGPPVNMIVNCDQELDRRVTDCLNPYRHYGYGYRLTRSQDPEPPTSDTKYLAEAWRMMREYGDPAYGPQATLRETQEQYRRLRVRYLTGDLSEDEWSMALQRVEKDELHAEAIQQVRDLYANAARDLIRGVVEVGADRAAIAEQVRQLVAYVNESFANIAKRFGRKAHVLEIRTRN